MAFQPPRTGYHWKCNLPYAANIPTIYGLVGTLLAKQKASRHELVTFPDGVATPPPSGIPSFRQNTMVTLCTEEWFTGDTGAPPKAGRQSVQKTVCWEGFLFISKWEARTLGDGNFPYSLICPWGGKTQDVWIISPFLEQGSDKELRSDERIKMFLELDFLFLIAQ